MEATQNHLELTRDEQIRILTRLTDAVMFEEFIRKKFVVAKSFSLEGSESLIPLLDLAIEKAGEQGMPKYLSDLARLEYNIQDILASEDRIPEVIREICLNPTVRLLDLSWKNLLPILTQGGKETGVNPEPGKELVVVWRDLREERVKYRVASQGDLLAMKIVEENIEREDAAEEGKVSVGFIDATLDDAVQGGILLAPASQITRDPSIFSANEYVDESFLTSHSFTMQWHITQACYLNDPRIRN